MKNSEKNSTQHAFHPETAFHNVFSDLLPQLSRAVAEEGYVTPTPIQTEAIPHLLKGRDLLGCAQTGTGKTAAFTLPILQHLTQHKRSLERRKPRVLILAPTRELVAQISESIATYGRHVHVKRTVIFGGVGQQPQVSALHQGVDIAIATPGRLLDLMNQRHVSLSGVEIFVLDEADRMLDMGFIIDIRKIIAELPAKRQSLFFSATLEQEVLKLANTLVHNAVHITVTPDQPAVERIAQKVFFVDKQNKDELLASLLQASHWDKVLVFTQMKHSANKVAEKLERLKISVTAIHGNKSQGARTEALKRFKTGRTRVLIATDIAARGLDVDNISHVINYDLPNEPETYVHRIGRTARAGAGGDAVSFCAAQERDYLRDIERFIRKPIPVDMDHPFHSTMAQNATGSDARPAPRGQRGGHRGGQRPSSHRPYKHDSRSRESSSARTWHGSDKTHHKSDRPWQKKPEGHSSYEKKHSASHYGQKHTGSKNHSSRPSSWHSGGSKHTGHK
jgi:ATP-dependent RNA helicase RhlE